MEDYKKLYLELFNYITDLHSVLTATLGSLEKKQQRCEELILQMGEGNPAHSPTQNPQKL